MFFGKQKEIQRLNLEPPRPAPRPPQSAAAPSCELPKIDPATLEAINRRAKEILESGRIPEWLFVPRERWPPDASFP